MRLFRLIFSFLWCSLLFIGMTEAQWMQTNVEKVTCFASSGTNLFAGTYGNGVYLSTDEGLSWGQINSGLSNPYVSCLALLGTNLFAGAGAGLFMSTDSGSSWELRNSSFSNLHNVLCLTVSGTNLFAGTQGSGVYLSTDNGMNWSHFSYNLGNLWIRSFAVIDTSIFAGTGAGIFRSPNNYIGSSWDNVFFPSIPNLYSFTVWGLIVEGTNLFAGTDHIASGFLERSGLYRSEDNGNSWEEANSGLPSYTQVNSFTTIGTNLIAGTNKGVFLSTNKGSSWVSIGLSDKNINCIIAFGNYLIAGIDGSNLWRRPLSDFLTSTAHFEDVSLRFNIEQNYPNPFNPTTKINYSMPKQSNVSIILYDVLGNEISTLVNEEKEIGSYIIEFNSDNLTSGIYFYQMKSDNFSQTKKMLLLR